MQKDVDGSGQASTLYDKSSAAPSATSFLNNPAKKEYIDDKPLLPIYRGVHLPVI